MSEQLKNKDNAWQMALVIFTKLSAWIGVPVVLAIFLGRWLDQKYNSEPWLFLTTVGVAFVISMIGLVTEALREFNKITQHATSVTQHATRNTQQGGLSENDSEDKLRKQ